MMPADSDEEGEGVAETTGLSEFFAARNSTQRYEKAYRTRLKKTLKQVQTPGKGETSLLHNAMMLEFVPPDYAKIRRQSARPGAKSKAA